MAIPETALLARLADGQSLTEIAAGIGVRSAEVERVWLDLLRSRLPPTSAEVAGGVGTRVEIVRDSYGVPHVFASAERDLFFGLGYAMAQDRLWQMDYLRRKASGHLSEL